MMRRAPRGKHKIGWDTIKTVSHRVDCCRRLKERKRSMRQESASSEGVMNFVNIVTSAGFAIHEKRTVMMQRRLLHMEQQYTTVQGGY
jgi:hypothetical protein